MLGEPGEGLLLFLRGRVSDFNAKAQRGRDAGQVGASAPLPAGTGGSYTTKGSKSSKGAIANGGEALSLGRPRFLSLAVVDLFAAWWGWDAKRRFSRAVRAWFVLLGNHA